MPENQTENTQSASETMPENSQAQSDNETEAVTADTPINSENYAEVMEARSREYDALEFKPIGISGLSCGDNCYVEYTPAIEGGADTTALCGAPECDAWIAAGEIPEEFLGAAKAKFDTAPQRDAAGNVMDENFPRIVAFQDLGERKTRYGTFRLPLDNGTYVIEGESCTSPANAGRRRVKGGWISGSATRDCRFYMESETDGSYVGINDCVDTYTEERSDTDMTVTVVDSETFEMDGQTFQLCPTQ
jgi:hypothetical protein